MCLVVEAVDVISRDVLGERHNAVWPAIALLIGCAAPMPPKPPPYEPPAAATAVNFSEAVAASSDAEVASAPAEREEASKSNANVAIEGAYKLGARPVAKDHDAFLEE